MRQFLAIALCLIAAPAFADTDTWGNVYPAQCSIEATANVKLPIITVGKLPYAPGHKAAGLWIERPSGNVILIKSGLSDTVRADAIRHELCHEIAGEWHRGAHQ